MNADNRATEWRCYGCVIEDSGDPIGYAVFGDEKAPVLRVNKTRDHQCYSENGRDGICQAPGSGIR